MSFLGESLQGRVLFAVPKKGRLSEKCLELLAGADIQYTRSHRLDVCLARNHNLALQVSRSLPLNHPFESVHSVFLPAADIPRFVGEGNVDLGITGQDMVAEANLPPALIHEVMPLEFGRCKLQVQVPEKSGITDARQLAGKRIATSFDNVAGTYFTKLDEAEGLTGNNRTRIESISGSVEAACALGLAEGIVDLVESGETMRAAGLQAIATILESQAVLIRSAKPNANRENLALIERIRARIAGVVAAGKYVLCNYNVPRDKIPEATTITPGRRAATVAPLDDPMWVAVSSMVLKSQVADVMDSLQAIGASDILLLEIKNMRT